MPTNDERSKVAARLRKAETSGDIGAAVGVRCGSRLCNGCAVETAEKLADLIEPEPERTCHDVTPWGDFFTCSECNGQVMLRPDVRWPDDGKILRTPTLIDGEGLGMRYPRFCPNCGARVIDA